MIRTFEKTGGSKSLKLSPMFTRLLIVLVLCATATAAACDPGTVITIENNTSTSIDIFFRAGDDAAKEVTVNPRSSERLAVAEVIWRDRVIARTASGEIVFDKVITWEDLKKSKRIVIESPSYRYRIEVDFQATDGRTREVADCCGRGPDN